MLYLKSIVLPDRELEFETLYDDPKMGFMTCYDSRYPFGIFPDMHMPEITFAGLTIFCGGNGSGKSTLLNVIAEKLHIARTAPFNTTPYFEKYTPICEISCNGIPRDSRIITSDDVFQSLLEKRRRNEDTDRQREALLEEYWQERKADYQPRMRSMDDAAAVRQHQDAWHKTPSRYVRDRLSREEKEFSNGESAYEYFTESIRENALYLLDEPENSLSSALQMKLAAFLAESVRFFGCQFVIATHSPLLLALDGAKIYDLDARPVKTAHWTEVPDVRLLHEFFTEHANAFTE